MFRWYEECMLALVFLRCLRRGLVFQLSADDLVADRFDDLVLVWRPKSDSKAHTLLVQISMFTIPILRKSLLGKYCTSYEKISKTLDTDRLKCVLLTNVPLDDSCRDMFETEKVSSVPGMDLLNCGDLYRLNPDNPDVWEAVRGNRSFVDHFYLLCRYDWNAEHDVYVEIDRLLGAGDLSASICYRLLKSILQWKHEETVYLTSAWSKWQELVDDYIREHVSGCRAVTTRLRYRNVADVRGYVESRNPAWLRPPERGTEALSATKVHQVVADGRHIVVPAGWLSEQYDQLSKRRRRILHCWGSLCPWLVIVDDDGDGNSDILSNMVTQADDEHRLVIVSSRENNGFIDTCQSSDVSDDSWKECLDVRVTLNGDCRLRDLVTGVDAVNSLKTLLDDEPALLLALALKMGRQPEPRPKQLVDLQRVPVHQLSSLGFRDVCITDTVQYESLRHKVGRHSVTSFAEVGSWISTPSKFEWPLYVLTDNLDTIPEKIRRLPIFKFHIIPYLSGERDRDLLREFDAASNVAIL